jgi:hypothetical protein
MGLREKGPQQNCQAEHAPELTSLGPSCDTLADLPPAWLWPEARGIDFNCDFHEIRLGSNEDGLAFRQRRCRWLHPALLHFWPVPASLIGLSTLAYQTQRFVCVRVKV